MRILSISWMDDEKREGILTLSTGRNSFQVYCYPCSFSPGDTITIPLQSLDDQDVIRVEGKSYNIEPIGEGFENRITALVEDTKRGIVSVGEVKIELGTKLPGDINAGEMVSFTSLRLQARKS